MRKKFLAGAVGIGLVGTMAIGSGGYAAYAAFDNTVKLTVDGKTRTMHTFGNTVGDVLKNEKLDIGPRDRLSPGRGHELRDGTEISVRYARPVTVTVDGDKSKRWVTALDVQTAMRQIDVRSRGSRVSVARSTRIDRDGLEFEVRTPKKFTVVYDGERRSVTAPALTVSEALRAADVKFDDNDIVQLKTAGKADRKDKAGGKDKADRKDKAGGKDAAAKDAAAKDAAVKDSEPAKVRPKAAQISDGDTIRLRRVEKKTKTRTVDLSYETVRVPDSDMYEDQTEVRRSGKEGEQKQRVRITLIDGEKKDTKVLSRRTVSKPVDRKVAYGTEERPSTGGDVGGEAGSLNWDALAECESGGDPNAVNSAGYYGLYQFSLPTWESVGGSGNPTDASASEQTYRAKLLYQKAGAGQWPVCGSNLYE